MKNNTGSNGIASVSHNNVTTDVAVSEYSKTTKYYSSSSTTISKLIFKIDNRKQAMLHHCGDNDGKNILYQKFINRFLEHVPAVFQIPSDVRLFRGVAQEAFDLFTHKKDKSKIVVKQSQYQNNHVIIVAIITDNVPLIVEALKSLMLKLNLKVNYMFHPVINITRDSEGYLRDIAAEDSVNESFIYMQVLGLFDDRAISSLTQEIKKAIDLVNYIHQLQPLGLNQINSIADNMTLHKELYAQKFCAVQEAIDFLCWLTKNRITFLAAIEYDLATHTITSTRGLEEAWQTNLADVLNIIKFTNNEIHSKQLIILGKINRLVPMRLDALVDYVLIKQLDADGVYRKGTIIFGSYSANIGSHSVKNVPMLRDKINYVLNKSDMHKDTDNTQQVKNIIESLGQSILFQIDQEDLASMCHNMLLGMRSNNMRLFIQQDRDHCLINIVIMLPRRQLTVEVHDKIISHLVSVMKGNLVTDSIAIPAKDFVQLSVIIASEAGLISSQEQLEAFYAQLEADLIIIISDWSERLLQKLCTELGAVEGCVYYNDITASWPIEYQYKFDVDNVLCDIQFLEQAAQENRVVANLLSDGRNEYTLKLYSPEDTLTLSNTIPLIENLGFTAINEQSFHIESSSRFKQSWIHVYKLHTPDIENKVSANEADELKYNVASALYRIGTGDLSNTILNKLITLNGFDWVKVKLIGAISSYLGQINPESKGYIQQVLVKHYQYTMMLVDLFEALFCPQQQSASQARAEQIATQLAMYLDTVDNSNEDTILKNMHLIIAAITRTNFYQQDKSGHQKNYYSFKFNSAKVPDLPPPVPFTEIFVYSNDFEGIHLRGGKIARGGIRWSDRGEDYRTEALGLLKAQMTKNTIIVPVGSKGVFFVNFVQGTSSRNDYMQRVIHCYQNFLRGLLDLTDNIVDKQIIYPESTVIYDEQDPYLVVAADKGTATFSDYANNISAEYNFWLGDAFASGGSTGYDHKKMAITAKGAWLSVQSHFRAMSIDVDKEQITVVGIGDMSGDVFGNGMLMSPHIKLVAAFDHRHIFIDPNPDPAMSYEERKRLFALPSSKWSDYNTQLISTGGGIFERQTKEINISEQIRVLLALDEEYLTPAELIRAVLRAKVDLIWNGGIGTYIKSASQSNIEIGDKSNDAVRVNGDTIRAKVIAEGGNLGLSQLGRIEFAQRGGIINTDFIDNSGGVDCSDHEVNIKIVLNNAIAHNKIDLTQRNDLLVKMTPEVESLVLADNYNQNIAITIASAVRVLSIDVWGRLIEDIESRGLLDRAVEFLPSKAEIEHRLAIGQNMTRPELAVLLSYTKMAVAIDISLSGVTQDSHFKKYLSSYFPLAMREQFQDEIYDHPLKAEIIKTVIANKMVNQLGAIAISAIKKETDADYGDIVRAYEVIDLILNTQSLWEEISALNYTGPMSARTELFADLGDIIYHGMSWFIKNIASPIIIDEVVARYKPDTEALAQIIHEILPAARKAKANQKSADYRAKGIPQAISDKMTTMGLLVLSFDIIDAAKKTHVSMQQIAKLYFECGEVLSIDWLQERLNEIEMKGSYGYRLSMQLLKDDVYRKQREIIINIVSSKYQNLHEWLVVHALQLQTYNDLIAEFKLQKSYTLDMLVLISKKLEMFLTN